MATIGTSSFTLPSASVPQGQTYFASVWAPLPNGLPTGPGLRTFSGPGGNLVAVRITDINGNPVTSLNPPGAQVCMTYPANTSLPSYGEAIQYYTGNNNNPWSTLPGPYTRTVAAGGDITLCTNVTNFN